MVTDEERNIYKAFGLKTSVHKVWQISSMVYYAEQKAAGITLPKSLDNVEDDPHQMGGDFILNPVGEVSLLYCSKLPHDRPPVDELLKNLKELDTTKPADDTA